MRRSISGCNAVGLRRRNSKKGIRRYHRVGRGFQLTSRIKNSDAVDRGC